MSAPDKKAQGDVLVVEDNERYLAFLQNFLHTSDDMDFELGLCSSLSEACDKARNNDYHAVLLDLHLPDSEGMETLQKLRNHVGKIPIVILTGVSDTSLALETIAAGGAWNYLAKHEVSLDELQEAVIDAVEEGWRRLDLA